jgi:hypothetical protein
MSAEPILTAETVLTTAIRNALAPGVGTHQGRPKVYYQLNTDGAAKPLIIFQFQDDITRLDWIGKVGATVPVTIKALAESAQAARELLETAAPGMNSLSYAGYILTARYLRSPAIPPLNGTYQSAHIFKITIERSS